MKELGEFSDDLHEKAGAFLVELFKKRSFPFILLGVGKGFAPFLQKIKKELPSVSVYDFEDWSQAIACLKKELLPGDTVLVKGSRGVQLDKVVDWLKNT
jgi:UDP-N-acetylmuramoyl-tripeptide--D-alanyl-D-alanine ligase